MLDRSRADAGGGASALLVCVFLEGQLCSKLASFRHPPLLPMIRTCRCYLASACIPFMFLPVERGRVLAEQRDAAHNSHGPWEKLKPPEAICRRFRHASQTRTRFLEVLMSCSCTDWHKECSAQSVHDVLAFDRFSRCGKLQTARTKHSIGTSCLVLTKTRLLVAADSRCGKERHRSSMCAELKPRCCMLMMNRRVVSAGESHSVPNEWRAGPRLRSRSR
jgi:hypothetical protein